MTISNHVCEDALSSENVLNRKQRTSKSKKTDAELVQIFWLAPPEAYFDQFTVAPVTGRTSKTLECERWKKSGIPFRKIGGRVLYQKKDVTYWLESHKLVTSTSEYEQGVNHG
ncbi:DNA-binding protein [Legionella septentrionalis]|uniref:DNA-binding protein n=1 Tax=Legionella septentrionalis TaxID=2498109 RepID=A0A3S0VMS0_9GAMM|nr:DNA-binding protein [Legionella septentrionalis]RUQ85044.1 DNA-binding protein [Legionella septentrionalis]